MADPFKDISLEQFEETVKDIDTRKNILETNPGDRVRVVKPKTKAAGYIELLRNDPKNLGFAFALDYVNKKEKKEAKI